MRWGLTNSTAIILELLVYALPIAGIALCEFTKSQKRQEQVKYYKSILFSAENTAAGAILDPNMSAACSVFFNEFCALSINDAAKLVFIATTGKNLYPFENIVNVEIEIDGNMVASPSTGAAVVGGVNKGVALSKPGTQSKIIDGKISTMALNVYVNDPRNPYYRLLFFADSRAIVAHHPSLKSVKNELNEWYTRFHAMIGEQKTEAASAFENTTAEEISKLFALLREGSISQDEFDALKKKALGIE